nr:MAG TPA: hypothetical protein [Caudoviricetes sp.]
MDHVSSSLQFVDVGDALPVSAGIFVPHLAADFVSIHLFLRFQYQFHVLFFAETLFYQHLENRIMRIVQLLICCFADSFQLTELFLFFGKGLFGSQPPIRSALLFRKGQELMLSKLTIEVGNLMTEPFNIPVIIAVIVAKFMPAFGASELFQWSSSISSIQISALGLFLS